MQHSRHTARARAHVWHGGHLHLAGEHTGGVVVPQWDTNLHEAVLVVPVDVAADF